MKSLVVLILTILPLIVLSQQALIQNDTLIYTTTKFQKALQYEQVLEISGPICYGEMGPCNLTILARGLEIRTPEGWFLLNKMNIPSFANSDSITIQVITEPKDCIQNYRIIESKEK